MKRKIGAYGEAGRGTTLVAIGSIHGNEPAGTIAIERVLDRLSRLGPRASGRFVGLIGNRRALAQGVRYLDRDLNRMWGDLATPALPGSGSEEQEHEELAEVIDQEIASSGGSIAFLDLHSTSAPGPPFSIISDSLANRRLAMSLAVPLVLGLEESIEGSLLSHLGERGYIAVGVEGGQHDDPATVDHHEAALWIALDQLGVTTADPIVGDMSCRLERVSRDVPGIVELTYRHTIEEGASFRIVGGIGGFDPVSRGEVVAYQDGVPVLAPASGLMMLPRYQNLGDDGFFVARPVHTRS